MTQIFKDEKVVPVTLIQAGPCYVTQIKNKEKDGYEAVQIGYEKIEKDKKIKKTMKGKPYRFLREIRGKLPEKIKEINVSLFEEGDIVDITAVSKGKGFAGGVKRWGFVDKAKAHGAKDMRRIGAIGSRYPQRVIKGRKMPGRMGSETVTVRNLKVAKIDPEQDILAVKGAVPGKRGTFVKIVGKEK